MTEWSCLPVRTLPLPGESMTSLLRRTAVVMGYNNVNLITRLLGETCRPHQNFNHIAPGPHLDRLAELLRLSAQALTHCTVHGFASALVLQPTCIPPATFCDPKTIWRYFAAQTSSVCPSCLAENLPYERLLWTFRPLQICTRHACPLLARCPDCQRPLARSRQNFTHCRCGKAFPGCHSDRIAPTLVHLGRRLHAWLEPDSVGKPELPSAVCFRLAERLTLAMAKAPGWFHRAAAQFDVPADTIPPWFLWLAAASLFDDWPDRLFEFLEHFQRDNPALNSGASRSFGFLLRDAADLEALGYPAAAEVLRRFLAERYTEGHVTRHVRLFRRAGHQNRLDARPWYTLTQAADFLQVSPKTIRQLVQRCVLDGQVRAAGKRGKHIGVVSKASAQALKRALGTALGVTQLCRRLAVGRPQVLELIRAGSLRNAMRTRRGWAVPAEAVFEIERTLQALPQIDAATDGWLPFRQASRIYGSSGLDTVRALQLVQEGHVAACRDGSHSGLRGLLLSQNDLETRLPELRAGLHQRSGFPLCESAQILLPGHPCREGVLKKWIRAGLLYARQRDRRWIVGQAEVDRFRATYCLASEACTVLKINRRTLARWETLERIAAVYGGRIAGGFCLYRRADVQKLSQLHAPPSSRH